MSNLTLPYRVNGNRNSNTMIVFMHGFPNTMKLWGDYLYKFENDYFIVTVSYPNFVSNLLIDNRESRDLVAKSKWGLEAGEIAVRLKNTIELLNAEEKRKVMFVSHDCGAIYTFVYDMLYPGLIEDFICLDTSYSPSKDQINQLLCFLYQMALALAFILGFPFGDFILHLVVRLGFKLNNLEAELMISRVCYQYFHAYKGLLLLLLISLISILLSIYYSIYFIVGALFCLFKFKASKSVSSMFESYKGPKRMVFIYGEDKLIKYHSEEWIRELECSSQENKIYPVKGGHWVSLYNEETVLKVMNERLNDYFKNI